MGVRIDIPKALFNAAKDVVRTLERQFNQALPVAAANSPSKQVAAALDVEVRKTSPTTVHAEMNINDSITLRRRNIIEIKGGTIKQGKRTFKVHASVTPRPTLAELAILFEGGWSDIYPGEFVNKAGDPYLTIWSKRGNQYNWTDYIPGVSETDFLMDRLREIIRKYGGDATEYI